MTKKNKKQSNRTQSSDVDVMEPYIVDMDVLSYASDDELRERNRHLSEEKDQAFKSGFDTYLWEVELAYVHREMGIRNARRIAHEKYLRTNPDAAYYVDSFEDADEDVVPQESSVN